MVVVVVVIVVEVTAGAVAVVVAAVVAVVVDNTREALRTPATAPRRYMDTSPYSYAVVCAVAGPYTYIAPTPRLHPDVFPIERYAVVRQLSSKSTFEVKKCVYLHFCVPPVERKIPRISI